MKLNEIEIKCSECDEDLGVDAEFDYDTIRVPPCPGCVDAAKARVRKTYEDCIARERKVILS